MQHVLQLIRPNINLRPIDGAQPPMMTNFSLEIFSQQLAILATLVTIMSSTFGAVSSLYENVKPVTREELLPCAVKSLSRCVMTQVRLPLLPCGVWLLSRGAVTQLPLDYYRVVSGYFADVFYNCNPCHLKPADVGLIKQAYKDWNYRITLYSVCRLMQLCHIDDRNLIKYKSDIT